MKSALSIGKTILVLIIAPLLLLTSCGKKAKKVSSSEADNIYVYITNEGEKYHNDDCQYLKHSKNEISLSTAVELDYSPCLVCVPPEIENKK